MVDFGRTFAGSRLHDDRAVALGQVRSILEHRGFYLRNLKSVVLPDLPRRRFSEVTVPMSPEQRRAYDRLKDELVIELGDSTDADFRRRISHYLQRRALLLRLCSDPTPVLPDYDELPGKTVALDALLEDLIVGQREKVVVWSFYRASLDRISERYAQFGISRIDGTVASVDERRTAIRRFQEDDDTWLFVGNPAAAGAGLTLHRARFAVYESMSNQAAHYLQSLDRIHRRGQEREVEYIQLLSENSLEQIEYEHLVAKADRQAELLGDLEAERLTRSLMLDELLADEHDRTRVP